MRGLDVNYLSNSAPLPIPYPHPTTISLCVVATVLVYTRSTQAYSLNKTKFNTNAMGSAEAASSEYLLFGAQRLNSASRAVLTVFHGNAGHALCLLCPTVARIVIRT